MLTRYLPAILTSILTLSCVLSFPAELAAQDELGIHVVRPGQTLEGIAEYYLGSAGQWREIWELNSDDIADPDLIYPGYKLKMMVPTRLPTQAALVTKVARRVEDKRSPNPWDDTEKNDFLQPLDVMQTFEGSSAELHFGDDTSLVITEQSRIILGEGAQAAAPVDRQQIEILVGQADLERRPTAATATAIEIVMGDTVVTPRAASAGETVQARTRRPEGQGAQLMVYQGTGDVAAGGEQVTVPKGMGTTVAEGGAPTPPEKLLDAPRIVRPPADSLWDVPNPPFEWQPVEGARSYTLEICRDDKCGELERRVTDLQTTTWGDAQLPVASFFWRVTATSPSGLDGYPSGSTAFSVVGDKIDSEPPRSSVSFIGPRVGVNDRLILGSGAEILAHVIDNGTGVAEWTPLLDGEETTLESWRSPWDSGSHTVSVAATDKSGNRSTLEPVAWEYDPDPPVISWGLEDDETPLGEASGEMDSEINPLAENEKLFGLWARTTGSDRSPLVWTSSKIRWLPMKYGDWRIYSDKPYIIVRARKGSVEFPILDQTISKKRGLWIHATDSGCGVESMTYQLLEGPQEEKVLVIEAVDILDNKSTVVWTLERD